MDVIKSMNNTQLSLPMLLTCIRLIGSPIILPFCIVYLLPYNFLWLNILLSLLFCLFGITDFFDGYLARKYNQISPHGAMLDHVADKFLLYSTLIALVAANKLYFLWAIIWIGREFFIMALRIFALENNISITVSSYGKLKTIIQIICLAFVIFNPYHHLSLSASYWNVIELSLLIIGTLLSVGSACHYLYFFRKQNS
jgi:CDP-diacylglycerol--glycerol-3-phosphate 3-phosphatidyltransferase